MSKVSLILLCSMAGTNFTLQAGQMVTVDPDAANRMIADRIGRKLRKHEPTEDQANEAYDFTESVGYNPSPEQVSAPVKGKKPKKPVQATPVQDPELEDNEDVENSSGSDADPGSDPA